MTISFKSGIYKITNTTNGKMYFGSSVDTNKRKNKHFSELARGCHHNKYLQNEYNKYGKNAFVFTEIKKTTKENLLHEEQKLLDLFCGNRDICYNLCPTAGSTFGRACTKETMEKISASKNGKKIHTSYSKKLLSDKMKIFWKNNEKRKEKIAKICSLNNKGEKNYWYGKTGNNNSHSKEVFQYDLKGNFIKIFDSLISAHNSTGVSVSSISQCCNKKTNKGGDYLWSYYLKTMPIYIHHKCREVEMIDIKTNKIINTFISINEASCYVVGSPRSITRVCSGKRKTAYGFFWRYKQ